MIAVAQFIRLPLLFFSSAHRAQPDPGLDADLSLLNPVEWAVRAARGEALPGTDWGEMGAFVLSSPASRPRRRRSRLELPLLPAHAVSDASHLLRDRLRRRSREHGGGGRRSRRLPRHQPAHPGTRARRAARARGVARRARSRARRTDLRGRDARRRRPAGVGDPADGVNLFLADGEAAGQDVFPCTCTSSRASPGMGWRSGPTKEGAVARCARRDGGDDPRRARTLRSPG